jgi:hypothetical protein
MLHLHAGLTAYSADQLNVLHEYCHTASMNRCDLRVFKQCDQICFGPHLQCLKCLCFPPHRLAVVFELNLTNQPRERCFSNEKLGRALVLSDLLQGFCAGSKAPLLSPFFLALGPALASLTRNRRHLADWRRRSRHGCRKRSGIVVIIRTYSSLFVAHCCKHKANKATRNKKICNTQTTHKHKLCTHN